MVGGGGLCWRRCRPGVGGVVFFPCGSFGVGFSRARRRGRVGRHFAASPLAGWPEINTFFFRTPWRLCSHGYAILRHHYDCFPGTFWPNYPSRVVLWTARGLEWRGTAGTASRFSLFENGLLRLRPLRAKPPVRTTFPWEYDVSCDTGRASRVPRFISLLVFFG